MRLGVTSVLAISLTLSACVEGPVPAPPPQQSIAAPKVTPRIVVQEPEPTVVAGSWADAPLTPGNWAYRPTPTGSMALYGPPGAGAHLVIACDRAAQRITLAHNAQSPGTMTVRATSGMKAYTSAPDPASPNFVAATMPSRDPHLDAIIYSRGRFMVSGGGRDLILPNWPEFARVVEDCR
jgi:hypothetical protein